MEESNTITIKQIIISVRDLDRMKLMTWLLINLVIGAMFVWFTLLDYFFVGSILQPLKKIILNGGFLIFSISLSASSISSLLEEFDKKELKPFRSLWFTIYLLIVIASSYLVGQGNRQNVLKEDAFVLFSTMVLAILILISLGLYAVRVSYGIDYTEKKSKKIEKIEKKSDDLDKFQGINLKGKK